MNVKPIYQSFSFIRRQFRFQFTVRPKPYIVMHARKDDKRELGYAVCIWHIAHWIWLLASFNTQKDVCNDCLFSSDVPWALEHDSPASFTCSAGPCKRRHVKRSLQIFVQETKERFHDIILSFISNRNSQNSNTSVFAICERNSVANSKTHLFTIFDRGSAILLSKTHLAKKLGFFHQNSARP